MVVYEKAACFGVAFEIPFEAGGGVDCVGAGSGWCMGEGGG